MAETAYPTSRLRASDRDRDAALTRLSEAHAQGRLTAAEHGQRVDAASHARTYGELAQLLADLPATPSLAHVHQLADELVWEVTRLGISRGSSSGC